MSRILALIAITLVATSLSSCGRKAPLDTPPPPGNQDQSQTG
ncbi:MAG: lipoprotein [Pseudomonadota bacterium]